jgi:hypothetical protein
VYNHLHSIYWEGSTADGETAGSGPHATDKEGAILSVDSLHKATTQAGEKSLKAKLLTNARPTGARKLPIGHVADRMLVTPVPLRPAGTAHVAGAGDGVALVMLPAVAAVVFAVCWVVLGKGRRRAGVAKRY